MNLDAESRLLIARTVLRSGQKYLLINQRNVNAGWARDLNALVREDACFAGVPRDTFVALDGDADGALESARYLAEELTEAGFKPVLFLSGSVSQNVHLWIRCDNVNLANIVGNLGRARGFDWRRLTPIRPPFTRHRTGSLMQVTDRSVESAIEALTEPLDLSQIDEGWFSRQVPAASNVTANVTVKTEDEQRSIPNRTAEEVLARISEPKTLSLLVDGRLTPRETKAFSKADGSVDRSRVLLKLALGFRRMGLDESDWRAACRDRSLKGLSHLWTLKGYARKRARNRAWSASKALHESLYEEREKSRQRAILLEKRACEQITGRGRETRILVYHSILELAKALGTLRVRIDIRRLTVASGGHRSTTSSAVKWLCRNGWLKRLEIGEGRRASLYQIPEITPLPSTVPSTGGRVRIVPLLDVGVMRRDLFRNRWLDRRGLGKTAGLILAGVLAKGPTSKRSLALALDRKGLSKIAFQRLVDCGLLVRAGNLWAAPDDWGLRLIAAEKKLGLYKVCLVQKRIHEVERMRYLNGTAMPYQLRPSWEVWRRAA